MGVGIDHQSAQKARGDGLGHGGARIQRSAHRIARTESTGAYMGSQVCPEAHRKHRAPAGCVSWQPWPPSLPARADFRQPRHQLSRAGPASAQSRAARAGGFSARGGAAARSAARAARAERRAAARRTERGTTTDRQITASLLLSAWALTARGGHPENF